MKSFIEHLKKFVNLQEGLWGQLISELSGPVDLFLSNVPNSGVVEFDRVLWRYKKHGLGVFFEEMNGKRRVDFHCVKAGSGCFDAWGLSIYFSALGGEGRKILRSVGISTGALEDNLRDLLVRMSGKDVVSVDGNFYRLL